jgi:hypothetical protein
MIIAYDHILNLQKEVVMKKIVGMLILGLFFVGIITMTARTVNSESPIAQEASEHPRIANAIGALEDAIHYMREAPHNFGGHKEKAIEASERAVRQLKLALAYRARQDKLHPPK